MKYFVSNTFAFTARTHIPIYIFEQKKKKRKNYPSKKEYFSYAKDERKKWKFISIHNEFTLIYTNIIFDWNHKRKLFLNENSNRHMSYEISFSIAHLLSKLFYRREDEVKKKMYNFLPTPAVWFAIMKFSFFFIQSIDV